MATKVCVFTGAGIGAPIGLPITSGFESTINQIEHALLQQIKSHLSKPDSNDIEQIMYLLEDFTNSSDFTHHIILQGLTINGFNEVNKHIETYKRQAKRALNDIKGKIYELLEDYKLEEASKLYSSLINEIQSSFNDARISMFTTNYDMSFENAFADRGDELSRSGIQDIKYGFGGLGDGKKAVYNPLEGFNWERGIIEYKKLHGSLDWQLDNKTGKCLRVGSALNPKNPENMPILYPGFKGTPSRQPFIDLHEKLDERLNQSEVLIVIGFAFRDDYLNNIFEYSIKKNKALITLCFNPCAPEKLPRDSKINQFANQFKDRFFHIQTPVEISSTPLSLKGHLDLLDIKHAFMQKTINLLL